MGACRGRAKLRGPWHEKLMAGRQRSRVGAHGNRLPSPHRASVPREMHEIILINIVVGCALLPFAVVDFDWTSVTVPRPSTLERHPQHLLRAAHHPRPNFHTPPLLKIRVRTAVSVTPR